MSKSALPDSWFLDGGRSSGPVAGPRAGADVALLRAARPGSAPAALVKGFDAWIDTPAGNFPITTQRYAPGVLSPDGGRRVRAFAAAPWPRWTLELEDGTTVVQEATSVPGRSLVALRWSVPAGRVRVTVRPYLAGPATRREDHSVNLGAEVRGWKTTWRPLGDASETSAYSNAKYHHEPHWYRGFRYDDGSTEDLPSPGVFAGEAAPGAPVELILAAGWAEVVEGMILPENPVLWRAPEKKTAAKSPTKKKKS
jgi:hypothetical protein